MASVYNYVLCKVSVNNFDTLVFKSTLRGCYLIGKDAAIEPMVEALDNVYGNRSVIINRLKHYLMMNVNSKDYFENVKALNGNHTYTLSFIRVTKAYYDNFHSMEMWGDVNLE